MALLAGPDLAARDRPGLGLTEVLPTVVAAFDAQRAARRAAMDMPESAPSGPVPEVMERRREVRLLVLRGARVQMARALDAPDGLRERLVRFWADHFTVRARVAIDGPLPSALVEDAIRPHVTGRFADMLVAVTLHPAMLIYLDQVASIGPNSRVGLRRGRGLNENLARELIELHTLGVDAAYSQDDIRALAELLTGLGVDSGRGTVFRPDWAEPGAATVLGLRYGGEGTAPILALLRDLAARPETAAHLARKIAVHMVADDPDPALVAALEAAWRGSGGDLLAVCEALLRHPGAWAGDLAKTRQPFDLVVASLRALGVTGDEVMAMPPRQLRDVVLAPMAAMGQPWQAPGGPDGWPEAAAAWITPQLLAARIAFAMQAPARLRPDLPEPVVLARRTLGTLAEGRLIWAVERAETRAEAVGLILASPMFNRR